MWRGWGVCAEPVALGRNPSGVRVSHFVGHAQVSGLFSRLHLATEHPDPRVGVDQAAEGVHKLAFHAGVVLAGGHDFANQANHGADIGLAEGCFGVRASGHGGGLAKRTFSDHR